MLDFTHEPQCGQCGRKQVTLTYVEQSRVVVNKLDIEYFYSAGALFCKCRDCKFEWVMNTLKRQRIIDEEKAKVTKEEAAEDE